MTIDKAIKMIDIHCYCPHYHTNTEQDEPERSINEAIDMAVNALKSIENISSNIKSKKMTIKEAVDVLTDRCMPNCWDMKDGFEYCKPIEQAVNIAIEVLQQIDNFNTIYIESEK